MKFRTITLADGGFKGIYAHSLLDEKKLKGGKRVFLSILGVSNAHI